MCRNSAVKDKLYAWHAPEVECIAKGKARKPYEFGVKVSLAVTAKEGFVVGALSMLGNPYDGHSLGEQLEQVDTLTGVRPKQAFMDRGYRGADVPEGCTMYISGQKRGVTAAQALDQAAQRHRATHLPHEERRTARALSPQRCRRARNACRVVQCRPQPAPVV
ncbi:transposase [Uliginosibacterium sp. IMCC34675]|uniref:Transposase n=1 Tax=Uliginosibacterium aquaticum TaxID=2731212 RepID=A0ABX2IJQ7_9RHOO|nr:transposase [Uliginosibacterium aquaticum]